MLSTSFVALALSAAAVVTAVPTKTSYKPCPLIKSPDSNQFGRTEFNEVNDWLFVNQFKTVDDSGVDNAQTKALFNRDETTYVETPGVGLLLKPAAAKDLKAVNLAVLYHDQGNTDQIAFVSTIQNEACVVPGSEKWTGVDAIYNGEDEGQSILECEKSVLLPSERLANPNTEIGFNKDEEYGNTFISSIAVDGDPKDRPSAVTVQQIRHLGVFIKQHPDYQKASKMEIDYTDIKGTPSSTFAIASKILSKKPKGVSNEDVEDTGFCRVQGSETWAEVKDVKMVVSK